MKKLPDAEFDVMRAMWTLEPPVTTAQLMRVVGRDKGWKTPALISLLNRLMERGFVRSEKLGRERAYYALVNKEDYLRFETGGFLQKIHGNSLHSFMASLADGEGLDADQIEELIRWAQERRR